MSEVRSTYELTADTQIWALPAYLCGISVTTDGTNDATAIVYDVSSASSAAATNKVAEVKVRGANHYGGRSFPTPVRCGAGIYLDVTGTGCGVILEWKR